MVSFLVVPTTRYETLVPKMGSLFVHAIYWSKGIVPKGKLRLAGQLFHEMDLGTFGVATSWFFSRFLSCPDRATIYESFNHLLEAGVGYARPGFDSRQ